MNINVTTKEPTLIWFKIGGMISGVTGRFDGAQRVIFGFDHIVNVVKRG